MKSKATIIKRRKTKSLFIGGVGVGTPHPVSIQSMTKTHTADYKKTVAQIKSLTRCGCEIVRIAIKNEQDAKAIDKIKAGVSIPLVGDIHFDYRLALLAIQRGVDALRLNPGNIKSKEEIEEVAHAAKKAHIPIRIGLNSGSLPLRGIHEGDIARSMVSAALSYIKIFEKCNFYDIIVSLKASDVLTTIRAYTLMADQCSYPFHLGVTAAGLPAEGAVKSAVGIGTLLARGIGDTIRVSLAAEPEGEVKCAQYILQSLGLRRFTPEVIACPTCGRAQVDIAAIAKRVEQKLKTLASEKILKLKIAVMGCEVNGPGEALDADYGVACGKGCGVIFVKGKVKRKVSESKIVDALIEEIKKYDG